LGGGTHQIDLISTQPSGQWVTPACFTKGDARAFGGGVAPSFCQTSGMADEAILSVSVTPTSCFAAVPATRQASKQPVSPAARRPDAFGRPHCIHPLDIKASK
ncbi:MAG TPA: hypothetical protein VF616_26675, partial [Duganella sp.]|uniref:hypothetical protein n=1 Tax=Duganella sp. TaxID=1904440 RepID=UPI002ED2B860